MYFSLFGLNDYSLQPGMFNEQEMVEALNKTLKTDL